MNSILQIAANTYKESVRDKILYNIIFMALVLILFSIYLGDWSVLNSEYVIKSFTFSVMSLSGLLLSIFVGINLIQKEIQKKTVLTILSKPLSRSSFILGKFLGLMLVVFTHISIMTVAFYFILFLGDAKPTLSILWGVLLVTVEMAVIVSVAILFSTFSTPTLSALFTFGVYLAGKLSGELMKQMAFLKEFEPGSYSVVMDKISQVVYHVFPDLSKLNLTNVIVHGQEVVFGHVVSAMAYGLCYVLVFLSLAIWWFSKKDFV